MTEANDIIAVMETGKGTIRLRLFADKVPFTVASFVNLAQRGFYDGLTFHRVIADFMVQTGCPLGTGTGGPGYKFGDEFVEDLRHDKPGILSMANAGPNTNGSQIFITHVPTPWLNGKHSVFGEVGGDENQAVVNRIAQGDKIIKMTIEGDLSQLWKLTDTQVAKWDTQLDQAFPNLHKKQKH